MLPKLHNCYHSLKVKEIRIGSFNILSITNTLKYYEINSKCHTTIKRFDSNRIFFKNEALTAKRIEKWFKNHNITYNKRDNNIWAVNKNYDHKKPTLLLNSHHDTVFPNKAYTRDPFKADIIDGKLFGLGSNDAGGSLVSLLNIIYSLL